MKKTLLFLTAILFCLITFAQDSTGVVTPTGGFEFPAVFIGKIMLWITVIGTVLTALAKLIPTDKPGSIGTWFAKINKFFAWLVSFLPDSKTGGRFHN